MHLTTISTALVVMLCTVQALPVSPGGQTTAEPNAPGLIPVPGPSELLNIMEGISQLQGVQAINIRKRGVGRILHSKDAILGDSGSLLGQGRGHRGGEHEYLGGENEPDEREPDEREPDEREPDEREPDEREPDERERDDKLDELL